jgi:hypothetical protein
MTRLFKQLWADDCGALLASELLFLYSMLVIGTVTGLVAMRQATVSELVESANALMALDQSYSFSGNRIAGVASTAGSAASDSSNTITMSSATPTVATISQTPCE